MAAKPKRDCLNTGAMSKGGRKPREGREKRDQQVNPLIGKLKPVTFWKTEEELAAEEAAGRD